jgi:ribosomal protein S18 acetylase RimI-like enzyme
VISGVVTHPDHRHKGAAKAVVCRCVNHLLAAGPGPITLTVVTINEPAIKLYRSLGFRITGKKTYYRELNEE